MDERFYQQSGGFSTHSHKVSVELERPEFDESYLKEGQYGAGSWRPRSLQRFASLWGFVALYSPCALWLVTVIQYTRTQVSSLERHFKINSFQSGLLMSSIDVGSICCVVIGSHFGKFYHIPRLLSVSAVVAGVSVVMISMVQMFTPRTLPSSTTSFLNDLEEEVPGTRIKYLCWNYDLYAAYSGIQVRNVTKGSDEYMRGYQHFLKDEHFNVDVAETMPWTYFWMMFFMFVAGASMSFKIPLQTYYVEQNVREKNQSGMYMGVMVTAMVFGSPVALFLGAVMNKKPVDLEETDMPIHDQNWISAWWLGYVVIGLCSMLTAVPVFFLPRHVVHKPDTTNVYRELQYGVSKLDYEAPEYDKQEASDVTPLCGDTKSRRLHTAVISSEVPDPDGTLMDRIKACPRSIRRVLSSPVIVLVLLDGLVTFTGVLGTMAFQLKYFENQFDHSAHTISLSLGVGQLLTAVVGTLLGGFLVTKYKMSRAGMFKLTFVTQLVALILSVSFVFIGCDNHKIQGFNHFSRNSTSGSSDPCLCADRTLFVCGSNGINYVSPCHAGCTALDGLHFQGCTAIPGDGRAEPGFCDNGCDTFYPVLLIYVMLVLVGTIGLTPRTLMVVRSVRSEDQALVCGLLNGLILRMAAIVGPILFGFLYDSTCLEWGDDGGACELSDKEELRLQFLGTGAVIRAVGIIFLFIATVLVHKQDAMDTEYTVIPDDQVGEMEADSGINGDTTPWWMEDDSWDVELDDKDFYKGPGGYTGGYTGGTHRAGLSAYSKKQ